MRGCPRPQLGMGGRKVPPWAERDRAGWWRGLGVGLGWFGRVGTLGCSAHGGGGGGNTQGPYRVASSSLCRASHCSPRARSARCCSTAASSRCRSPSAFSLPCASSSAGRRGQRGVTRAPQTPANSAGCCPKGWGTPRVSCLSGVTVGGTCAPRRCSRGMELTLQSRFAAGQFSPLTPQGQHLVPQRRHVGLQPGLGRGDTAAWGQEWAAFSPSLRLLLEV